MKTYTEEQLAAIGLEIIEGRRKGGRTILKKYGRGYFSELRKKGIERQKALKEGKIKLPIDS